HQVEQDDVGLHLGDREEARVAVRRLGHVEPFGPKQRTHHPADVALVVDDQDAGAHCGSRIRKVAPWPGVSVTTMVPPCCSMVCRRMARPRPVPSRLSVKYGWKMTSRLSGGMPGPVSEIVIAMPSASCSSDTRT